MAELEAILACTDTVERLDAALAAHSRSLTQWFLVDASRTDLPARRIFRRSWLHDGSFPKRLRIDPTTRALDLRQLDSSSAVVLLTNEVGDLKEPAYQTIAAALERSALCLRLRQEDQTEYRIATLEGGWHPLPLPQPSPMQTLTLEIAGRNRVRLNTTFPCRLRVESAYPRDQVYLGLVNSGARFAEKKARFELRSSAARLGAGTLVVDLEMETGGDQLTVRVEDFADSVEVLRLEPQTRRPREERFLRGQPTYLHLLFDRTTLDQEAWPRALRAVMGGEEKQPETDDQSPVEGGDRDDRLAARQWNLRLRRELASALAKTLDELHGRIQLDLWWFADVPRDGIRPPPSLPSARTPFGHSGQVHMDHLDNELQGATFDYATGIDLFDAVDEVLEKVAEEIELANSPLKPAVLIVGDSPPPPADEKDPIWKQIVDGQPTTNARLSRRFQSALNRLEKRDVPVGWLFVRHVNPPSASKGGRLAENVREHFPLYQNLRENVLSALGRYPHLKVQPTQGIETLTESLRRLFGRMAAQPVGISELQIEGGP